MSRPTRTALIARAALATLVAAGTALAALSVLRVTSRGFVARPAAATVESRDSFVPAPLPAELSQTGLYLPGTTTVDPRNLAFVPQYPLWTDGAEKRRFIRLPEGESIDASDPDRWVFPRGTKLWKEFSLGRRVETRFIERLQDGGYRFAAYVWDESGARATLAPEHGVRGAAPLASGGAHDVPARADCASCHEGRSNVVLGFGALQLSDDRDPLAPHREDVPEGAVGLSELVRRGLVRGLPEQLASTPPRIAAPSPVARAAQGYLYANCAGCHNGAGPLAGLELDFDQFVAPERTARARETTFERASRFRLGGATLRIAPGAPERSSVALRMRSRDPIAQMPPLGTHSVDEAGVRLVERWITEGG